MRRPRVFTDQPLQPGGAVELAEGPARHLVRVLRMRPGDAVVLFNGDGHDYSGALTEAAGRSCRVEIKEATPAETESPLEISLVQGIARGERMDWAIQKAVELGAGHIQPVFTERTEVRLDPRRAERRLAHWQQVMIAACEQCGRARIPSLATPIRLQDLPAPTGLGLCLDPRSERTLSQLRDQPAKPVSLVIGPEGGLADAELDSLQARGFVGLRLGPRVLRTETAGAAAIAVLQALWGDWK
ncbi:MAG: 16S rRNA (uracil(1498)-N(3))-methyltransferase [Wenzhouxiangella sp.]|nr:MAG: 16S rRNA (uracil(1498)-N(3))-methyltransferase [Wenzhouxiangella sp.]